MMRISKALVALLFISAAVTSCKSYQYVKVGSYLNENSYGGIVHENDTLLVTYTFSGQNGPIAIEVFNKLDKPLFISWKNSSLVIAGQVYPFWTDEATFQIKTQGYTGSVSYDQIVEGYTDASSIGILKKANEVDILPPYSFLTYCKERVTYNFLAVSDSDSTVVIEVPGPVSVEKAKIHSFNSENTPLQFSLFLNLSVNNQFEPGFHIYDQFWISEVVETKADPSYFPANPANIFHLVKKFGGN